MSLSCTDGCSRILVLVLSAIALAQADLPLNIDCTNEYLCKNQSDASNETEVRTFLDNYNCEGSKVYCEMVRAQFQYYFDEKPETSKNFTAAQSAKAVFDIKNAEIASFFLKSNETMSLSEKAQLERISVFLNISEDKEKLRSEIIANMTEIFGGGVVCNKTTQEDCSEFPKNDSVHWWPLDPTLDRILATSSDYDLLQYIWEQWRKNTGAKMRDQYSEYVKISNEAAKHSGFSDMGEFWRVGRIGNYGKGYDFKMAVEKLWEQVLPLYEELHAYVRHKLKQHYKGHQNEFNATLPAHVLGNMWTQQWNNVFNILIPFPNSTKVDVTDEMRNQNYNATTMFEVAKEFFKSIGLDGYNDRFFNDSMIVRPEDTEGRTVECYSDSETFYNNKDYGMSTCTKVTMEDLITIHHEMGHINYFMQYSKQPLVFQDGANAGFHEAIGDTMALSATTTDHLEKIGLLDHAKQSSEQDINFLFNMALQKIAFLPFGYMIDQYRWNIFEGKINESRYQEEWWNLKYKYQGIHAPGGEQWQTDESLFDAGSKFHVANDVPYIRYFVSFIIQFQFHEALCDAAGGPPTGGYYHRCDIFNSTDAGNKLKEVLQLGSSIPWQEAMEKFVGSKEMDASKLVQYFKPLLDYLSKENEGNGECYGWGYDWGPDIMKTLKPRRCQPDGSVTIYTTVPPTSTEMTTPAHVFPKGTNVTFHGSLQDNSFNWTESLLDQTSDVYLDSVEKYEDNLTSILANMTDFASKVTVTGFSKVSSVQAFVEWKQFRDEDPASISIVLVHFNLSLQTTKEMRQLPSENYVSQFLTKQAKEDGYDYADIHVKEDITPTTPSTSTTTTPSTATKPADSSKYRGLAIAALVISCIVIVVVLILIVYLFRYKNKEASDSSNHYSTLDEAGDYEISSYRQT